MATQVSTVSFGQRGLFVSSSQAIPSKGQVILRETPLLQASDLDTLRMGFRARSVALTYAALFHPKVYQNIMKSHPITDKTAMTLDQEAQQDLANLFHLLPSMQVDTIVKVFVALTRINLNFTNEQGIPCSGYYPQLSYVNHSCQPNCELLRENHTISLVSLRPLAIDEQLFISYTITKPPLEEIDLSERQILLFKDHSFRCRCRLCEEQQREKNERLAQQQQKAPADE